MRSAIAIGLLHNLKVFFSAEFSESEASRAIGSLSFAMFGKGSRKSKGKMPNCTPGKSWSCGYACLPMSKKNCGSVLPGQAKTYADYMAKQAGKTKKTKSKKTKTDAVKAPDTNKVQHKSLMTEAEAIAYTKDSAWSDRVFFHGTSRQGADSITADGIDMSKNLTAVYGQGFYMGGSSKRNNGFEIAAMYGSDKNEDDFTVLEMRVNVKNPRSLTEGEARKEIFDAVDSGQIKPPDFSKANSFDDYIAEQVRYNKDVQDLFKKQGYDGLHITDNDYFIAFDPKQVAIYQRHDNPDGVPPSVVDKVERDQNAYD